MFFHLFVLLLTAASWVALLWLVITPHFSAWSLPAIGAVHLAPPLLAWGAWYLIRRRRLRREKEEAALQAAQAEAEREARNGGQDRFSEVPPFYSIRHHAREEDQRAFWYATREASVRQDDAGADMELSFVDLHFTPQRPELEVLSINLTCSNRDLPAQLPFGGSGSGTHPDFTVPQLSIVKRARPLRKPTASVRPPVKRGLQWRLISHLSLNHLSLTSQGKQALQEMLALYNHTHSSIATRQIQGIVSIESRPSTTRAAGKHFSGFVRGLDIVLTVDEQAFVGAGMVLFGSVLDRFFALYCGPNSFTRLTLRAKQREEEIAKWPARTGEALVI